ncbi:MAG: hypothetical protein ACOYJE_05360 [Bacteroidaceae bacterium]|jgi:DnaJ-class molecular chaperone
MTKEEISPSETDNSESNFESYSGSDYSETTSEYPSTPSGHYETKTEQCSNCLGRGYNPVHVYHGGGKSSTIQRRCSFCHGKGSITKREYVLDN